MKTPLYLLLFFIGLCCCVDAATPKTSQKAVLVTGASSGIGNQIAMSLMEHGYYVYAGARKAKDIKTLSQHPNMQGIRLDVTIQKDINAAVAHIKSEGRGLYGVVNNAGVFLFDPLIEVNESDMEFIFDVNVMGPYRITKAFAPLVIESKGRISTIGSVAGLFSGQLFGPYGMTKHAMEAFSEALNQEMKKFDVKVSIIEPGNFQSDIMKNMSNRITKLGQSNAETQYGKEIKNMASFVKTDRSHHAAPTPVADAVVHFMSESNPKFRYLVTPSKSESDGAIKRSLQKTVELNHSHPYSQDDDEIIGLLKTLLTDVNE